MPPSARAVGGLVGSEHANCFLGSLSWKRIASHQAVRTEMLRLHHCSEPGGCRNAVCHASAAAAVVLICTPIADLHKVLNALRVRRRAARIQFTSPKSHICRL